MMNIFKRPFILWPKKKLLNWMMSEPFILWPRKKLFNWVMGEPVSTQVVEPVKEIETIHIPAVKPPQSPVKELKRKTSTSSTSSVGKLKSEVKDDKVITPIETPAENTTTKPKSKRYKSRHKKRKPTNEQSI